MLTPLGASLDEQSNPLLKGKEGLYLLKSLLLETVFKDIHGKEMWLFPMDFLINYGVMPKQKHEEYLY
ncbi:hypothetical protein EK904_002530 [Melospiza melodia maxima]|nr:hypothetical protein EK904_002530 [Melospiza melodia maxima]